MESAEAGEGGIALEEARSWEGHRLDEIGGGRAGSVIGVLVGTRSGRPEWLLAQMGRFGHHTVLPIRDAVEAAGRIWVPYSLHLIRAAPRVEPGDALGDGLERELLDHYGILDASRSAAGPGDREPGAIAARPA